MNIPNFQNTQFVDRNGYLTQEWQLILQNLITQLQKNVSDEGFQVPQQPTATIASLQTLFAANATPSQFFGDILYDSTTDELKVNIAGTFRVVTVV